jgi:Fe-S cluster biogenesis protein NfuA
MSERPDKASAPIGEAAPARAMRQIEDLVARLENGRDAQTRDLARELAKALLDLHRQGLARLLALAAEWGDAGQATRVAWVADPLISHLLLLHDLHPIDVELRVAGALAAVRPQLQVHGGDVALVAVSDGTLVLQLQGQCDGCASSTATMRQLVLDALCEAAPDVSAVRWESGAKAGEPSAQKFVPLERLSVR